jgi:beta-ribofuranosylaminobenzene 5'-phosphate synthase
MVDLRGDLGRIYASIGVAIDRPNIILKATYAPEIEISGSRADRTRKFAETILDTYEVEAGVKIDVTSDIPEHSGFGSGTQLALAVGTALSELFYLDLHPDEIALKLNRSQRSGIGTYAFQYGGFIVDGGHRTEKRDGVPPLLFRFDIPQDWRFVIGLPKIPKKWSGEVENKTFQDIKLPSKDLGGCISRVLLLQMIPALLEKDIHSFGIAMTNIDRMFGEYWSEPQGGVYSHPIIKSGIEFLLENGVNGVGQSSWGPTLYGIVEGESEALKITEMLEDYLNTGGIVGDSFVVRPNNKGAEVKVSESSLK